MVRMFIPPSKRRGGGVCVGVGGGGQVIKLFMGGGDVEWGRDH